MKDKSATVKEGWQFLSSTMDVQQAMSAMEKQQNGQDVAEEEMAKLEEAMMGKIMLVTWRGTRFEVASVLRQVVDGALAKEPGVSETQLVQRAKAILIIGSSKGLHQTSRIRLVPELFLGVDADVNSNCPSRSYEERSGRRD